MTTLLPPEITAHAPLEAPCPHCGAELVMSLQEIYADIAQRHRMTTPEARRSALMYHSERVLCPGCEKPIDVSLTPHTSWELNMTAPDPLEYYTPNSRYWEAQKRGLPTGSNLKLGPEMTQ